MKKILSICITLILSIGLIGCGGEKKSYNYEVKNIDDSSFGDVKRYSYRVVVDDTYTEDDLLKISNEIIKKAQKDTPYNALCIFFHNKEDDLESMPSYGKIEHVPYGEWSKAQEVKTGKYSSFEIVNNIKNK